jgi:6,7-dimethyl-8-ribityllumazine synthase
VASATVNLALVVAEFNHEVTGKMLERALKRTEELGARVTYVCKVPGSFDMPIIIQDLLERPDVDAVAALGAIVKGETAHDEIIASALADEISRLSTRWKKPVALGVSGPRENWDQAKARAEEYANRSVQAAIALVRIRNRINQQNPAYPVIAD